MDLSTAQALVGDPSASFVDYTEAAMALATHPDATPEDLEACRRRGGHAEELADVALRVRAAQQGRAAEPLPARKTA